MVALLLRAALAVALALAAPAVAAGGAGWEGWPVLVWRQDHRAEPFPPELAVFGGANVERDDPAPWVLERGLDFYVGHAPGRDELHLERDAAWRERAERWFATRDPALLARAPCLTDPALRARLHAALGRSLAARGGRTGLFASLGDEVSLTPWGDPFDLCRSPTCEAAWRALAAREGWPERAPTTDELRVSFSGGDARDLGAWLARRRFHQDVVVDLLAELAGAARERSPGTLVGLLGAQGRTAFGGVAVERVASFLDVLEAYPVEDARELFATLRRPGQRALVTVFPEAGGPDASAWQLAEHALRGGDGAVLWSDRELARAPELRERLARAVAGVRAARALTGAFLPRPAGVALVSSPDSIALAWLRDALPDGPTWPRRLAGHQREHGSRERAARSLLRWAEDAGALPGALLAADVGAATVERFPVLLLGPLGVLSDGELAGLAAFARAGGTALAAGELGTFDERGRRRGELPPELLAGLAREAPRGAADYAELRAGASASARARAEELCGELRALLDRHGALPPVRVAGGELPWLVACGPPDGAGARACAALPNASDPELRARLAPVRPEVAPAPGLCVEWLSPAPGADGAAPLVPAGDAVWFRLVPEG